MNFLGLKRVRCIFQSYPFPSLLYIFIVRSICAQKPRAIVLIWCRVTSRRIMRRCFLCCLFSFWGTKMIDSSVNPIYHKSVYVLIQFMSFLPAGLLVDPEYPACGRHAPISRWKIMQFAKPLYFWEIPSGMESTPFGAQLTRATPTVFLVR